MVTWKDYLVEHDRRREMLADAALERSLVFIKSRQCPVRLNWFQSRMVWVGAWLESLGLRMQRRYGAPPRITVHFGSGVEKVTGGC